MDTPNRYSYFYILTISMIAALGGLLFGYDWVIIGGAKIFYEPFFHIVSEAQCGWMMSSALLGCIFGAFTAGTLSDKFGRKNLLIATSIIFIISALGTALSNTIHTFVIYRITTGFAIGMASAISPIYIAEVTPQEFRGRMVAINQLTIVIGILIAQFVNFSIAQPVSENISQAAFFNSWNVQFGWRYMFGSGAVPALLFFIMVFFIPRSPRWLMKKGLKRDAQKILERIGGKQYSNNSIEDMMTSLSQIKKMNIKQLFIPITRRILLLGMVLAIFQQWCGINVIFNYAQEVFSQAGYSVDNIFLNIVIVGSVNLIFTIVSMFLIDKVGRRKLLLLGAFLLLIIYLVMGACYFYQIKGILLLLLVVLAIASYATTLAPVTWVVLSEIFPNAIRGTAMAIATLMLWVGSFTLTFTFPILNSILKAYGTFWLYAFICAMGFTFVYFRLPETKQQSLEEIEASFKSNAKG